MDTAAAAPSPPAVGLARGATRLIPLAAVAVVVAGASPAVALLAGIGLALTLGNPWLAHTRRLAHRTLAWSVAGLGAGMDLRLVGRVGLHGLGYTALTIGAALLVGTALGRRLGVARDASLLVTVGTAICGGSAIAAVAPAIGARDEDVSVALVTVFLLNAVALLVFPALGHRLHLGQDAFGLWCALAIHDTSSVVGAAAHYGERALVVATAAKLARALWIVPVTFAISWHRARTRDAAVAPTKPARPWFIAGFLAAAALVTFVPSLRGLGHLASAGAHRLLAVTLFLMGLNISRATLRSLGLRPLVQAVALWVVLAGASLAGITTGVIG